MSERYDTREGVDSDFFYLMFDLVADDYNAGKLTLQQALGKWAAYQSAIVAPRPQGTSIRNLD